jgi:hypothetical protein
MRWSEPLSLAAQRAALTAIAFALGTTLAAQDAAPPPADAQATLVRSVQQMQTQIQELQAAISELRAESAKYHAETLELRSELQAARPQTEVVSQLAGQSPQQPSGSGAGARDAEASQNAGSESSSQEHPPTLEEQMQLLSGKVDEQYQTKVESASKYRIRLSGIVLVNLFNTRGNVDNSDIPHVVIPGTPGQSNGSFGGTLRQSMLGLEVFGPEVAGAKTTADIQFDFGGGFAQVPNGVTSGIARLRTATMRFDWANTSLVGGQDSLFFAPLSPTSLASFAIPALAYSGNLWSWTPQLRVEHRIKLSEHSSLNLQAGILDPLTGESPTPVYGVQPAFPGYRVPQAGEASKQPAIGSRVSWTTRAFGQPLTIGAGGYYSRENWGFYRRVDGWAGSSDWTLPLGPIVTLSGEFYRGRAVGGLGGGIGRSVFINPSSPATALLPLDAMGGWSQIKIKPITRLEFNIAAGQDSVFGHEAETFVATNYYDQLARNRGAFANFIYHPRSNLLFSLEYRRLRTNAIDWNTQTADHVNVMMGILF